MSEVIAARHDGAGAGKEAVCRQGDSSCNRLHSASESLVVIRFYDQVKVIALDGVVNQPEALAGAAGGKALAKRGDHAARAQGREPFSDAQGDERRGGSMEPLSANVMDDRPPLRFAAGTLSGATSAGTAAVIEER